MEAVPRLPMLSFELKSSPETTSFGPKLKQYIRDVYHEDPEMYNNEIHMLEGCRATAVCAVKDVTGCSALKRYYCQLHFLQSRFPMAKDGAAAVPFTWRDTYASMVCTLADIRFEMVSILYNIGALHSQLGASDSRVTADGMKLSCTHFQCAAWAFQHLKDTFPQPAGVDLAPDVMQFMYHLSLAQAQECILEKSMMDNRKATIIAKVAVQIVDYYNLALNTLDQGGSDDCSIAETVGSKIYKNWKRYVKFKIAYHSCVSLLYQGQQSEEQQKMGERVAYYHAASAKLEEAIKLSKGMENIEAVNETITFTMDVVEGKKKAAKNENEFIYHEEVPDIDSLPDVKGASLVKGIPFNVNDPEVSGPDIFARLVPMKAHEASSMYSEEKAKLLRRTGEKIDEKDQELVTFMTSLQLDHLNLHCEPGKLPQELVDRCAALSAKPNAIQSLVDSMNKLADTYHDVEGMLQDIKELIQLEETREKEYQEVMGKRPPSIVATDMTRETNKYQEAHAKASESNQTLHKAMTLHISNLKILSLPLDEIQKQIPSLTILNSPAEKASIKEMQLLVGKVEEMRRQRAMLATQLRESTCQDDITHQLITRTGESLETIFSQEMQKHQKYVSLIDQNLAAQDNILKALTDAYACYAGTRKATNEIIRKREATINSLISSYDAYEDLLSKSSKGLEFYRKLETNVSKLLQRVKGTCKVQEEEREQILAQNNKTSNPEVTPPVSSTPKLKDYLKLKKDTAMGYTDTYYNYTPPTSTYYDPSQMSVESHSHVPAVRPAPVGSEGTNEQISALKLPASENQDPKYEYPAPTTVGLKITGYPVTTTISSSPAHYNYTGTTAYNAYMQQYNALEQQQQLHYHQVYAKPQDSTAVQGYIAGVNNYPTAIAVDVQHAIPGGSQTLYGTADSFSVASGASPSPYGVPGSQSTLPDSSLTYNNAGTLPAMNRNLQTPYGTQTAVTGISQNPYNTTSTYPMVVGSSQVSYGANGAYFPVTESSQMPYSNTSTHPAGTGSSQGSYNNARHYSSPQTAYDAIGTYSQEYGLTGSSQLVYGAASTNQTHHVNSSLYTPGTGSSSQNVYCTSSQAGYGSINSYPVVSENPSYTVVSTYSNSGSLSQAAYATANNSQTTYGIINNTQTAYSDAASSSQAAYDKPSNVVYAPGYSNYVSQHQQLQENTKTSMTPHLNQSSTQFQYMTSPSSSCYTNAGSYNTSQTCSSQTSIEGHTYAAQYNASSSEIPVQKQTSYYSLPYGYQYGEETANTLPVQGPQNIGESQNVTPNNQMTYMHARGQNSKTNTTYTQQGGSHMSQETSNLDLLAGLDFSLNQKPLVPEQTEENTVGKKEEKVISSPIKQVSNIPVNEESVKQIDVSEVRTISLQTDSTKETLSDTNQEEGKLTPKSFGKDPYMDPETLNQFVQEVEKYEKFVDGLTNKTLNGPTPLDMKWKELLELQEKDAHKRSISVARCYPMKNRFPDILPYDHSRIELPSTKDDYINASYMKNLTPLTPPFIITQAPLPSTYSDFWTMVWEQQVEVIVCLLSNSELQDQVYWPAEKGQELPMGKMKLTLQSSNVRPHWTERIISVCVVESRATRVIVHLQFTTWPGSSFPSSPGPFLSFVTETFNFYSQQRGAGHPVVVHCLSGVGRTGLFCLVAAAVCEIQAGRGLLDLVTTTACMSTHRKGSLRDREHLKFAYQAVLYYAQDMLMKRGILTSRSTFEDKRSRGGKSHTRHPSEDFLLGPPTDLSQLQSGIEKMGCNKQQQH